jgi:hypothetical protein
VSVEVDEHDDGNHELREKDLGEAFERIFAKVTFFFLIFLFKPLYTLAGFDLTTHSASLPGGRRRVYVRFLGKIHMAVLCVCTYY